MNVTFPKLCPAFNVRAVGTEPTWRLEEDSEMLTAEGTLTGLPKGSTASTKMLELSLASAGIEEGLG